MPTHRSTKPASKRCIGLKVDLRTHRLVPCPELVKGAHANRKYHSKQCYEWSWHRYGDGFRLGDIYLKGQHRKQHPSKPCEGWIIRDGTLVPCGESITRGRCDKVYHSLQCFVRTRRWRARGYQLGQVMRKRCDYRYCKKGPDGTKGILDRINRQRKSGLYFCDARCRAAEKRIVDADKVAAIDAGELVSSPLIDKERIARAARLEIDGINPYKMTDQLYPPNKGFTRLTREQQRKNFDRRFDRVKKFLKNNRKRIDLEKKRQGASPGTTSPIAIAS